MPTRARNASMSARGTAEPPAITARNEERSASEFAAARSRSFQIVGTPADIVGRCSEMILRRCSPWRNIWGMSRLAPTMYEAYGVPHAFAWNMGTMASSLSFSVIPSDEADVTAIEWRNVERWL